MKKPFFFFFIFTNYFILNGMERKYEVATDMKLVRSFSLDYHFKQFNDALLFMNSGNESKCIKILTDLAAKGNMPSKLLLYEYYNNKCSFPPRFYFPPLDDEKKFKAILEDWFFAANSYNYPPAQYEYGIWLIEQCNDKINGLTNIKKAAVGKWIKKPNIQTGYPGLCYHYYRAAEFLKNYYNEHEPKSSNARKYTELVDFLDKNKRN